MEPPGFTRAGLNKQTLSVPSWSDDPSTFNKVLNLCYEGATKIPVPGIQKQALGAMGLLMDRLIPTPVGLAASVHIGVGGSTVGAKRGDLPPIPEPLRGPIVDFLKQAVGVSMIECALRPGFDLLDIECKHVRVVPHVPFRHSAFSAAGMQVLVESAKCQLLYVTREIPGVDFSKHFATEVLPRLGVPPDSALEYVEGVRKAVGIADAGNAVRTVALQLKVSRAWIAVL